MDTAARLKLYKELHFYELENREKIESRLKFLLSIFILIASAALYLFSELILSENFSQEKPVSFLFFGVGLCSALTAYFFIRSLFGYVYKNIPTADTLESYYSQMTNDFLAIDHTHAEAWTDERFTEYLLSSFRESSTANTINNRIKADYWHKCTTSLVIMIFLTIALAISYLTNIASTS